jgi:hypothetical protein
VIREVGNKGFISMACLALKGSPSLKRLIVHNSKCRPWGTSLGKSLKGSKKIEVVYIHGSGKLKDPGAEAIAAALPGCLNLSALVLSDMGITTEGREEKVKGKGWRGRKRERRKEKGEGKKG